MQDTLQCMLLVAFSSVASDVTALACEKQSTIRTYSPCMAVIQVHWACWLILFVLCELLFVAICQLWLMPGEVRWITTVPRPRSVQPLCGCQGRCQCQCTGKLLLSSVVWCTFPFSCDKEDRFFMAFGWSNLWHMTFEEPVEGMFQMQNVVVDVCCDIIVDFIDSLLTAHVVAATGQVVLEVCFDLHIESIGYLFHMQDGVSSMCSQTWRWESACIWHHGMSLFDGRGCMNQNHQMLDHSEHFCLFLIHLIQIKQSAKVQSSFIWIKPIWRNQVPSL